VIETETFEIAGGIAEYAAPISGEPVTAPFKKRI
jgi:hypothetical protein